MVISKISLWNILINEPIVYKTLIAQKFVVVRLSLVNKSNNEMAQPLDQETVVDDNIMIIQRRPIMMVALDVLSALGNSKKVTLKARGDTIPNAVAIANIITEKMLKGNSRISDILVDSEYGNDQYSNTLISTIQIVLTKN
ncbi:MAG: hypothetical protein YK1309IOTA_770007 [Marine Group I thaumarchaeote]|nr:MAG: hypothetical protein NPMRIOTA_170014 [Nitrosopumilales archaeon]GFN39741.1 MAG: hypothetical protein YK1309IOTA_770007 [Marine Group I thaumarchaeote]